MKNDIKNLDPENFYDILKISPKLNDLNENYFSDDKENDEHLAWKPLKI